MNMNAGFSVFYVISSVFSRHFFRFKNVNLSVIYVILSVFYVNLSVFCVISSVFS